MAKHQIPTYTICRLAADEAVQKELIAERFPHYLDTHRHLHFPHRHSFYHLVFFTKGAGKQSIDFVSFPVQPGQIYFMVPGQVHGWDFDGEMDGYIINFSDTFFHTLLQNTQYIDQFYFFNGQAAESVIQLPVERQVEVTALFEKILEEVQQNNDHMMDMIRTLLLQIFILVNRIQVTTIRQKQVPQHNYLLLRNFQQLIEKNYTQLKLPKEYAALLYITPNHLNALCKDVLDKSAGEIIRDRILLEAKRLLTNADMSIMDIAYQLNFADNSYFSKFFKKYAGATPEDFRKQFDHTHNK